MKISELGWEDVYVNKFKIVESTQDCKYKQDAMGAQKNGIQRP